MIFFHDFDGAGVAAMHILFLVFIHTYYENSQFYRQFCFQKKLKLLLILFGFFHSKTLLPKLLFTPVCECRNFHITFSNSFIILSARNDA